MTSYRERQDRTAIYSDRSCRELLRTFRDARGSKRRIWEASKKHGFNDVEIQKALSETAINDALNGKPVWEPVTGVLDALLSDVISNPRPWCEPPEVPESFDEFCGPAGDYATSNWWFDLLKLDDLCKQTTFQSWLSRGGEPKVWPEIRERVIDWRARVMRGLDRWEERVFEQQNPEMMQTIIKDALDTGGLLAAARAMKRFQEYDAVNHYRPVAFDPAEPERPQFDFEYSNVPPFDASRLRALIESGFPRYRSPDRQPDYSVVERTTRYFCSDNLVWEWESECEVEKRFTWDPKTRTHDRSERVVRVRVKKGVSHAVEGETLSRSYQRVWDRERRCHVDAETAWVWRWRKADEYDTLSDSYARERMMRLVALNEHADFSMYLKQKPAPIEPDGDGRRYTVD